MNFIQKTPLEVHRDLVASGVFGRFTQEAIAEAIGVDQGTVSRIANGDFKRINKSVLAICKYADVNTLRSEGANGLRTLVASTRSVSDPEKRKLVDIIRLAADLLERP